MVAEGCEAERLPELAVTERVGFVATEWGVAVAPSLPRVDGWFAEHGTLGQTGR